MKNGSFSANHIILKNKYKIICHNGTIKIFTDKDFFLRTITTEQLEQNYENIKPIKEKSLYTIKWFLNGKEKGMPEKIIGSYSLCKWKIEQIKHHFKLGKLLILKQIN